MGFEIHTDYPFYFYLLCLLAGAAYAFFLYVGESISGKRSFFTFPKIMLAIFRFAGVALLSFLLLSPFVKDFYKRVEKPVIVIAADNSQSVLLNRDSTFYREQLEQKITALGAGLGEEFDVEIFNFGGGIHEGSRLTFDEKKTNLSQALDKIYSRFYNRNLGAMILVTDGILNEGTDPIPEAKKFRAPIYTVPLGDTVPPADIRITGTRFNKIVYSGNKFPVEIETEISGFKGQSTVLTISGGGRILFSRPIAITERLQRETFTAILDAGEPGLRRFEIIVRPLDGEISKVNNRKSIFIDILESKKKLLLVSSAPHPDVAAIKRAITNNEQYEVDNLDLKDLAGSRDLKPYNLVIFHQVPSLTGGGSDIIKKAIEQKKPMFFILGSRTNFVVLNNISPGFRFNPRPGNFNDVTPVLNGNFNLFTPDEELGNVLSELPPLTCQFGDFTFPGENFVLLNQEIGNVETTKPLLAFTNAGEIKTGFLAGEGIWRWFLAEYAINKNNEKLNQLISRIVQYLSVKADKRFFRLKDPENIFFEDQPVTFEAELYNQSYEPVSKGEVKLIIRDSSEKVYNFDFRPAGDRYLVNAGFMAPGSYTYSAVASTGTNKYSLNGEFIVKEIDAEHVTTTANHQLLYTIAEESGGQMVFPSEMEKIEGYIENREDVASVAFMEYNLKELINNKFLFLIILILFSLEWFLRKFYGKY